MPALCARAGMDFSKIWVKSAKNRPKISPMCEGWHQFLKNLGILVKMLHEGLVWKISTGGASPLRGASSWRSYSEIKRYIISESVSESVTLNNSLTQGGGRAGNSGGTREPSSQKQFGFSESFCGFEIFTKLNSEIILEFLRKLFVFVTYSCFSLLEYINNFVSLIIPHYQKGLCTK